MKTRAKFKGSSGLFFFDGCPISREVIDHSKSSEYKRLLLCGTCGALIDDDKVLCAVCPNKLGVGVQLSPKLEKMGSTWREHKIQLSTSTSGQRSIHPLVSSNPQASNEQLLYKMGIPDYILDGIQKNLDERKIQADKTLHKFLNEGRLDGPERTQTASNRLLFTSEGKTKRVKHFQENVVQVPRPNSKSDFQPLRTYGNGQDRPHHIDRSKNLMRLQIRRDFG